MKLLNFENTSVAFSILLAVCILIHGFFGLSLWVYFGLYVAYSAVYFWGAFNVASNFFMPVICSKATKVKVIALSFDDGPGVYTEQILQILHDFNMEAAFFCIGKQIELAPSQLQCIHAQGHLIGNHSYSHHFWFDCFPAGKILSDLRQTDALIERLLGVRPKLFRPPYGVTLPWIKRAVNRGDYTAIGWNMRSLDTVSKDPQKILRRICSGIAPGAIFLFHDTVKITPQILKEFLTEVRFKGYQVVRLDKMLELTAYASRNDPLENTR